jgi:hypothetical protein
LDENGELLGLVLVKRWGGEVEHYEASCEGADGATALVRKNARESGEWRVVSGEGIGIG